MEIRILAKVENKRCRSQEIKRVAEVDIRRAVEKKNWR